MKIDSPKRSMTKALIWRVLSLGITFAVSIAITKNLSVALSISLFDTVIKMVVYYYHERYWSVIKWGRKKHKKHKKKQV